MFKVTSKYARFTIAFMFLVSVFGLTASAQKTNDASAAMERERLSQIMHPSANIEEFRQEYLNYLTELEEAVRIYNEIPGARKILVQKGIRSNSMLAEAKTAIAEMPAEDLIQMRTSYAKFPGWREAPQTFQAIIRPELLQRIRARLDDKIPVETTAAIIADDCAAARSVDPSNADIAVLQAAGVAAQSASDILLPPTNAVLAAAAVVAHGLTITAQTLKATVDDCDDDDFQTGIVNQLSASVANDNTNTTTILTAVTNAKTEIINNDNSNKNSIINNDNLNKDTIVNNDNANKTAIINNDNANTTTITTTVENAKTQVIVNANANKDEILRLMIHADLAAVDSATPVAVFMLPAAQGGYLELVRTIVAQMITDLAGSSTAQANSFLAQGDAFRNAGNYKSAYASYRKAYKAATK